MSPEEAIKVLEALKDRINDDGKRELSVVQKAILEWVAPPPAEEKATVSVSAVPVEPEEKEAPVKAKSKAKTKAKNKKKR